MASRIRGSRRLLAAITQLGNARLRAGAGAVLFPRGLVSGESSAGARLGNLRQFTAGTPPSYSGLATSSGRRGRRWRGPRR